MVNIPIGIRKDTGYQSVTTKSQAGNYQNCPESTVIGSRQPENQITEKKSTISHPIIDSISASNWRYLY